jgi:hypothetical protein
MGREALCMAEFGGWTGNGKLLLETDDIVFRGAQRLRVQLRDVKQASTEGGWLVIVHTDGTARFDLGNAAAKWAHAINNPKTRIDKLDVKGESKVLVDGLDDDVAFMEELRARTISVDTGGREQDYDLVFMRIENVDELEGLATLSKRIKPVGAIWIVHPKRRPDLSHDVLVGAAKTVGLIDTKTARFSGTHTGLKLMVPKAKRV